MRLKCRVCVKCTFLGNTRLLSSQYYRSHTQLSLDQFSNLMNKLYLPYCHLLIVKPRITHPSTLYEIYNTIRFSTHRISVLHIAYQTLSLLQLKSSYILFNWSDNCNHISTTNLIQCSLALFQSAASLYFTFVYNY